MAIFVDVRAGAKDYEAITVADTAIGLTAAKLAGSGSMQAVAALLSLETAAIRFRLDGADPTANEGHLMNAGDFVLLRGADSLQGFKAIQDTGSSGTLRVTYFRG